MLNFFNPRSLKVATLPKTKLGYLFDQDLLLLSSLLVLLNANFYVRKLYQLIKIELHDFEWR